MLAPTQQLHAQRGSGRRGTCPVVVAALVAAAVLLVPGWIPASAAGAGTGGGLTGATQPSSARAASRLAGDWDHIRQVVSWLRYRTPPRQVVYLLGGSATRESVTGESTWSTQLQRLSGKSAAAYVLTSSCQTFAEDASIVRALPEGRGVALISVGVTRFPMAHRPATLPRHSIRLEPPGRWNQHRYDSRTGLSAAEKRRRIRAWLRDRYPTFVTGYPGGLVGLEKVIHACRARGVRPVLLEMPIDLVAVGNQFDAAIAAYQEGCFRLAADHGVQYLRFASSIGLRDADFYDLWHLLPSGRGRWQSRLSRELVHGGIL